MSNDVVLSSIKAQVQQILPDARIILFGSRAYGIPTEESDWDILILTQGSVNHSLKKDIHDVIFPISVKIGSFINTLTAQESEWNSNPSYYSLQQTIKGIVEA